MDRNPTAFSSYVLKHYGSGVMSRRDIHVTAAIKKDPIYVSSAAMKISSDTLLQIKHRIWKLCSEPRQSISGKVPPQIFGIGTICPKCGSNQFSISVPDIRPADWPKNVLGSADCRGCNGDFLVKLAPELENAFSKIMTLNEVFSKGKVMNFLFRE